MMLLVTADVTMRFAFNAPIPGAIELVRVLMIVVVFAGMAYTGIVKGHVRVEILIDRFSPTARLATITSAQLVAIGIVAVIAWQTALQTQFLLQEEYRTGMLHIPLWPFAMMTAFFLGLLAVIFVVEFLESFGQLVTTGIRNCVWLIPGVMLAALLFVMSLWPSISPAGIAPGTFGIIAMLLLFALIFLGTYIGAAMALITLWGVSYLISPLAAGSVLGMISQAVASNYNWTVMPMFMMMGLLVAAGQLSKDLYDTAYKWLGHMPGGLASTTVAASGALAAVTGSSFTGIATLTPMALPQMRAYKYDDKLATGVIAASSTIGILIPPSIGFIVYGILVEQSVGRLFIAGIIPGILMTLAFIVLITIRCWMRPTLGPPGPATNLAKKLVSLKGGGPVIFLFLLVIGGIYAGVFTPTEAGAIGAFATIIVTLALRRFTLGGFLDSLMETVRMTAMIFFIFVYANSITQFLAVTKLPFALAGFINGLAVPPYVTLAVVLGAYLFLGCVMNSLPALILTLPIIYPTVVALGFDPIWFGVLLVIMVEIGQLTPPIGMNVFMLSGICNVPMYSIFRGVIPFWITQLGIVGILIAFPQIALWLPNRMMGG